jgi:hypothetical protein
MKTKFFAKAIILTAFAALPLFGSLPLRAAAPNNQTDQTGAASAPALEPTHFTKVIEDLPLMPGLELVDDEDVLFDAPGSGRIAETNAMGPVDADDVYKFYKRSLPHLGWRMIDFHTYRRESEELRIDARANQKITLVTFTVKPVASGKQ